MQALPIKAIQLKVRDFSAEKGVSPDSQSIEFQAPLQKSDSEVKASLVDQDGKIIAGSYMNLCEEVVVMRGDSGFDDLSRLEDCLRWFKKNAVRLACEIRQASRLFLIFRTW